MSASNNNNVEITKLLVENAADIHAKDNEGFTAFLIALKSNKEAKIKIIKILEDAENKIKNTKAKK